MPFGKNARIRLEHGGTKSRTEHYETVTYWYGMPGASLVKTDELQVGDPASEKAHAYASPKASASVRNRVALRVGCGRHRTDVALAPLREGKEVYPAHTDRGRTPRARRS